MKKLDVLILKSFIGPFVLTTLVSTFILLTQYMLKYFDDFVGKNLGIEVFAELILYFSLNMMPVAIPLGVLLSSLMTFGNLGEHFELTAIKSAGISLIRALLPIGFFVCILTIGTFFFNNHVVPAANLKAYSLLYDIKNKKPALDIRAGQFYGGIDGFSIKANEKLPDNKTLKEVIIYDHSQSAKQGNKTVILADSAIMFTILNEKYLKFELYNGNFYDEIVNGSRRERLNSQYVRNQFKKMVMVFNLASFDLKETNEELFQNNRQMKNISELSNDIDSLKKKVFENKANLVYGALSYYKYHFRDELFRLRDSINKQNDIEIERLKKVQEERSKQKKADSLQSADTLSNPNYNDEIIEKDISVGEGLLKKDTILNLLNENQKVNKNQKVVKKVEKSIENIKQLKTPENIKKSAIKDQIIELSTEKPDALVDKLLEVIPEDPDDALLPDSLKSKAVVVNESSKLQGSKRIEQFTKPSKKYQLQNIKASKEENSSGSNTQNSDNVITNKTVPVNPALVEKVNQKKSNRNRKVTKRLNNVTPENLKEVVPINYDTIVVDSVLIFSMKDSVAAFYDKFKYKKGDVLNNALSKAKNIRNKVSSIDRKLRGDKKNIDKYTVEKYKKFAQSFACIVMFLIGAPLGSIIKKGGLGVPVIVSIFFFIVYYVLTITSEKWAKEGLVDGQYAVWYSNIFLLPFGFYFLSRAKVDARLFEIDSYVIWFQKRFKKRKREKK